jgi:hypothetical protein
MSVDDSFWERWSPVGGIVFAVLIAVSGLIAGSPPKLTDPTRKILDYLRDNQGVLRWSAYIGAVGTGFALWWAGSVWRTIRRAEGGSPLLAVTAVGGLLLGLSVAMVASIVTAVLATPGIAVGMSASELRFVFILGTALFGGVGIGIIAFAGAFSVVIIRTRVLPSFVGWFGLLVAIVWIPGAAVMSTTRDAVYYITFAGFLLFALWALVTSITMLRRPVEASTT